MVVSAAVDPTTKRWTSPDPRISPSLRESSALTLMMSQLPSVLNSSVNRCMLTSLWGQLQADVGRLGYNDAMCFPLQWPRLLLIVGIVAGCMPAAARGAEAPGEIAKQPSDTSVRLASE